MQRQGRLLRSMARWFSVVPPSHSFVSVADIRCTYSFDEKRRPTGQINYDRAGNVLSKSSLEYREDSVGNGFEKKVFIWDMKSEPPREKLALTSLRTITYY